MKAFLDGIGKLIGKIADNVQGRVERLKNEKIKLLEKRHALMQKPSSLRNVDMLNTIDIRLYQINATLGNKATD